MSGPEIDYNKLRNDGFEYAGDLILDAERTLTGLLDLHDLPEEVIRKYPLLIIGIAMLACLDARAEEFRLMKEAELNSRKQ